MGLLRVQLSVIRSALRWLVLLLALVLADWLDMVLPDLHSSLSSNTSNSINSQVIISRQQTTHSVHPDITVHQWPLYARKVIRVHLRVNSGDIG